MSINLKTFYSMMMGAWGGLLAWVGLDFVLGWQPENPYLDAVLNAVIVGMLVGALVGGFGGLMERRVRLFLRGLLIGVVTGVGGGVIGLLIGEGLFRAMGRGMLWRALGWSIFGLGIGLSDGIFKRSPRRMMFGGLGGFIGGFLGACALNFSWSILARPATSRAVGFTILGAFVGLFMGLIPGLFKRAWLKVVSSGRNEGKEYIMDKGQIIVGSDDGCDLGLFGDESIVPRHAEIKQDGGRFVVQALAQGYPATVNNAPVTQQVLNNEDVIGIGRQKILFRKKEG